MEKMERALGIWIEDQTKKRVPLSSRIIQEKAKRLFESLNTNEETVSFQASKGWFENFKKRFSLHNVKITGESASADHEAANRYPTELKQLIESKGYHPDQVFNADETGLFWKRMPARTFVSQTERSAPGFKAAKDRLTLLFCCNASGNHMIKPLLVYKSIKPRALKNKNMNDLPVFWRANKKGWVTAKLFTDWFLNCFIPSVKQYLASKSLPFKALLLIDNAPGHPETLKFCDPNIEVQFLPPNTTSLIQPLDQGIIAAFKKYYVKRTFSYVLNSMEQNPSLTVTETWKSFNIAHCITFIKEAVDELRPSTLNACWRKLWPEVVADTSAIPNQASEIDDIVRILHQIHGEGFDELQPSDVEEVLAFDDKELSETELLEILEDTSKDEGDTTDNEITDEATTNTMTSTTLTLTSVQNILRIAQQLQDVVYDEDPSLERSLKFSNGLNGLLQPYREIEKDLRKKMKQPTILHYFRK